MIDDGCCWSTEWKSGARQCSQDRASFMWQNQLVCLWLQMSVLACARKSWTLSGSRRSAVNADRVRSACCTRLVRRPWMQFCTCPGRLDSISSPVSIMAARCSDVSIGNFYSIPTELIEFLLHTQMMVFNASPFFPLNFKQCCDLGFGEVG